MCYRRKRSSELLSGKTGGSFFFSRYYRTNIFYSFISEIAAEADNDEDLVGPKLSEKEESESELLTRDDSWRKEAPIRDWDKGKQGKPREK